MLSCNCIHGCQVEYPKIVLKHNKKLKTPEEQMELKVEPKDMDLASRGKISSSKLILN